MTDEITVVTETGVLLLATDRDAADNLTTLIETVEGFDEVHDIGVNTRSGEVEVHHKDGLSDEVETKLEELCEVGCEAGVPVRRMMWSPETIIRELAHWVGRDVQEGWYEGDEWLSAAEDYRHGMYYVDGDAELVEGWIEEFHELQDR